MVFKYQLPPRVTSLSPAQGVTSLGGTTGQVMGTYLINSGRLKCKFGSSVSGVAVTFVRDQELRCVSQ